MAVRQFDQRAPNLSRVGGTGRIVRIDDDQRPRAGGDEAAEMIQIQAERMTKGTSAVATICSSC